MPIGYKDEAIYQFYKFLVVAPLDPALVHVVVHPNDPGSFIGFIVSGMVHLQVDAVEFGAHSFSKACDRQLGAS